MYKIEPRKTLAAFLVEQKKDLIIAEIDLPYSLSVGQVLVEIEFSGICGSQVGEIEGVKGEDKWLPHLLGHEGSGTVIAVGPGVTNFKPGNKVIAHWRIGTGINSETPKYKWNNKIVNAGWVTTFNKYSIISENRLTLIPLDSDLKTAALYGCAITTGFGTIENKAKIKFGENIVIFGAGGIGLNIIQGAKLAGAGHIIAVDIYDNRLNLAMQIGADHIINANNIEPFNQIKKFLNKKSIDVFIDNTGNANIIQRGYESVKINGRVILVGVPKKNSNINIYSLDLHFGKTISGTSGGEINPTEDIGRYMGLILSRNIDLNQLITDIEPLKRINLLIEKMKNGISSGRCIVDLRDF